MSAPSQRGGNLTPQAIVEDVEPSRVAEEVQSTQTSKLDLKNEDISGIQSSAQPTTESRAIQQSSAEVTTQGHSEIGKSPGVEKPDSPKEGRAQPNPTKAVIQKASTTQGSYSDASAPKSGLTLLTSQPKSSSTPQTSRILPITSTSNKPTTKSFRQQGSATTVDSPAKPSASFNSSCKEEITSVHSDEILSARTLVSQQENNLINPVSTASSSAASAPLSDSPAPADGPFPYIKHRYVAPYCQY